MRYLSLIFLLCAAAGPATRPSEDRAVSDAYRHLAQKQAARRMASTQPAQISVAELEALRAEVIELRAENAKLRERLYGKQKPEPKGKAGKVESITVNQLKAAGSEYVGKRVSMKCRFIETDDLRGGRMILPNVIDWSEVHASSAGGPLGIVRAGPGTVDPSRAPHGASGVQEWISLAVSDGDQQTDHVYAVRKELGKPIGALRRGDAVTLEGAVVELENSQGFGLILDRVAPD